MNKGKRSKLKLFPSNVEPPPDDPQVARILVNRVRLERTRQFGACYLGLELWKRLELDRFSSKRWTTIRPMCPGGAWPRYWRSTDDTAFFDAVHRVCAPIPPATSKCAPFHPCCGGSDAKTFS